MIRVSRTINASIAVAAVGKNCMSWDEAMSNREEIKTVAPAVIMLRLCEIKINQSSN